MMNTDYSPFGYCDECENWDLEGSDWEAKQIGLGICKIVPLLSDCVEWDSEATQSRLVGKWKDHLAFTQDASSYVADLYTAPRFGCPQFKKRERQ